MASHVGKARRNPLVLRLSQFAVLSVEEVALLEALCVNEERFAARVDIIADDVPDGISAEDHAAGLASSLTKLAACLER